MSRPIEFRAWDRENNCYFQPTFEAYKGNLEELHLNMGGRLGLRTIDGMTDESLFPDRFVLQQFTGFQDKHGVDIYEGDIAKWRDGVSKDIYWDADKARWRIRGIEPLTRATAKAWVVIGNVFEHPGLLEAAS